jgi:hypothetical protein
MPEQHENLANVVEAFFLILALFLLEQVLILACAACCKIPCGQTMPPV